MTTAAVLLTGATGFIGRHLAPALEARGRDVVCGSRHPGAASRASPRRRWVELDVDRPDTLVRALTGCTTAYYLVHSIGGGSGYPDREAHAAERFARAAERAGLERVVYLGGVAPPGEPSRHLASRIRTGAILRASSVPSVELRAAMIIGAGGSSWVMVRDLARRLPAMILPRWLRRHSWPVAIDDVVTGLLAAAELPIPEPGFYDVPGPERVTHRELIQRTAAALGRHPAMVDIPLLTPRLSSYWIGWITRADMSLARELVQGASTDLDPSGPVVWDALPDHRLVALDTAIDNAIADEGLRATPTPRTLTRLRALAAEPVSS